MALWHLLAVAFGLLAYFIGVNLIRDSENRKIAFEELPKDLHKWRRTGDIAAVNGRKMFYINKKCQNTKLKNPPTFAIIHGFPSSSYEYHKALDGLSKYGNVVLSDHIGFGFSDAPKENYTYSIMEAAENILALWRHLGLKKAHIVSHDMGDSVLTEILARRYRRMLPLYFDDFFQSVTFTNGGINFKMINFRITQIVFMYPKIAKPLSSLVEVLGLRKRTFMHQIKGIWSPFADPDERDQDIEHLYQLNLYNGLLANMYNANHYLWDRQYYEYKWFAALKELDLPCRFVWGGSDSVSPIDIPKFFANIVPNFDLTIVEKKGHFWMLEDPDTWVKEVVKTLEKYNAKVQKKE